MAFVIDASVAAAWLLPDDATGHADAAFARLPDDEALVPGLFWLEMRNIPLACERRGRIDAASADRALDLLVALPIRPDHAADGAVLMRLARRHALSAYDAPISNWRCVSRCLSRPWIRRWLVLQAPKALCGSAGGG